MIDKFIIITKINNDIVEGLCNCIDEEGYDVWETTEDLIHVQHDEIKSVSLKWC